MTRKPLPRPRAWEFFYIEKTSSWAQELGWSGALPRVATEHAGILERVRRVPVRVGHEPQCHEDEEYESDDGEDDGHEALPSEWRLC